MAIYKIIINGEFGKNDSWFTIHLRSDAEWVIPKVNKEIMRVGGYKNIFIELSSKRFVFSFEPLSKWLDIELYAGTDAPILAIEASMPGDWSTLTVSSSVDSHHVRKAEIGRNIFTFDLRLV